MDSSNATHSNTGLSVWDVSSLVVGIVVGTAIFKTPPAVFGCVASPIQGLAVWALGAFLALCGALCYCELATLYPEHGAEYTYLSRAFGHRTGFLFAWMQITVILTGSIGAMAYVFSDYLTVIWPATRLYPAVVATVAVLILMLTQSRGIRTGKGVQNILTIGKVVALGMILISGMLVTSHAEFLSPVPGETTSASGLGLALVFVLYAYGGWNDVATVTPEVHNHSRNMPRALLLSLSFIAVLYLALNLAYLNTLGMTGLRNSDAPAADVVDQFAGFAGSGVLSIVVMLSALGAIHGMLFSACRLLSAVGQDYTLFTQWNQWNKNRVPIWSLISLCSISIILILAVGTLTGQNLIEQYTVALQLQKPDWGFYNGGFNTLVAATAPVFWFFFALSGVALIVLRFKDQASMRPFRVPLYPFTPLIFIGTSLFMLYSSLRWAGQLTLLLLPIFLVGLAISFTQRRSFLENQ